MNGEKKKKDSIFRRISLRVLSFHLLNEGKGNPNDDFFSEYIGVLYSLSYAIRMSSKAGFAPKNYFEYTVYPLEGVWDISDEAKKNYTGQIDKKSLVFNLMIRQPGFVTKEFFNEASERTKKKKPHELLNKVRLASFKEGKCVQMMHLGSYDNEPKTFKQMEMFCKENNLTRQSKEHKEIYLSDVRKVSPEKLKTVLRFKVKHTCIYVENSIHKDNVKDKCQ